MNTSQAPRRRHTQSDKRIVAAAQRLFIERGLGGVNMDLIAAEAGVARQTIYNRFENKESVFRAAIEAHWAALSEALSAHLDPASSPETVLREIATDILRFIDEHDQVAMTRMVIAESRFVDGLADTFFKLGKAPLLERFREYLRHATKFGALSCNDPEIASAQYLGMIQESLFWPGVMGMNLDRSKRSEVVDAAVDTFLRQYGSK